MEDIYEPDTNLESIDFFDLLQDNTSNILTDNFLASKKKLSSANNGRSEAFDKIRLKGKAVEMINLIMTNNKDLIKTDDLYHADEIRSLFLQSKNDKSLFESISKK